MLTHVEISCPYCGELIEISIDSSANSQEYIEDCSVCCQPIHVAIRMDEIGEIMVTVQRDND